MAVLRFFAWFSLNAALALLLPIVLLPLLGLSRTYRDKVSLLIRSAVQDGQLFWSVIALSAAACYEVAGHMRELSTPAGDGADEVLAWLAMAGFVITIVVSAVLVLLGAMDAVNESVLTKTAPRLWRCILAASPSRSARPSASYL